LSSITDRGLKILPFRSQLTRAEPSGISFCKTEGKESSATKKEFLEAQICDKSAAGIPAIKIIARLSS